MAKKIQEVVNLQVPAGRATAGPPLGPALSQYGVNAGEFVNQFNEKTQDQPNGLILKVIMNIYEDRSFSFEVGGAPTSELIRRALKIEKGSPTPNVKKVGTLSQKQLEEIAQEKMEELNTRDIEQAKKTVAGTAKQMGIEVE